MGLSDDPTNSGQSTVKRKTKVNTISIHTYKKEEDPLV